MNDEQFFAFVEDQYKDELSVEVRIFGRLPVSISVNVIIGGLLVFLTSSEYLVGYNMVVVPYYAFACFAVVLLAASFTCLVITMWHWTAFRIKPATQWDQWRTQYEKSVREAWAYSDEQVASIMAKALAAAIQRDMMGSIDYNQATNDRRYWWLNRAFVLSAAAFALAIIEGACWLFLEFF